MAYEKQTWECGETITAEKLNHIEDGIADASSGGGGTLKLNIVDKADSGSAYTYTYDHTWQEVHDAIERGESVLYQTPEDYDDDSTNPIPARYLRILNVVTRESESRIQYFATGEALDGDSQLLRVGAVARASSADSPIQREVLR